MAIATNAPNGILITQPAANPWHYGLYSAATLMPVDDTVRWPVGGVMWSPDTCAQGGLWPGGFCQPQNQPSTWAMTYTAGTGTPVTSFTSDAPNRPFYVTMVGPPKSAGKTVTSTTITWGDGSQNIPGDFTTPPPYNHQYPEQATGSTPYTFSIKYTYSDASTDTTTGTVAFSGAGPVQQTKTFSGIDWQGATPFAVYNGVACTPVGFQDATARAIARLGWNESRLVERGFYLGEQGNGPALASTASTDVTPAAMASTGADIVCALGALEQYGVDMDGGNTELVIHAPRSLAAMAASQRLVIPDGPVLRTPLGNVWAFGAGYTYAGPGVAAADKIAWMYATGPVVIRRSSIVDSEVFNQFVNQTVAVAERMVLVTTECVQLACKVNAPCAVASPPALTKSAIAPTGGASS